MYDEDNHGRLQWTWMPDYTYNAKAYKFEVLGKVSQCLGTHFENPLHRENVTTHTCPSDSEKARDTSRQHRGLTPLPPFFYYGLTYHG